VCSDRELSQAYLVRYKHNRLSGCLLNEVDMVLIDCLGLYSQVTKCIRWMPWQSEAMKDV
jgi:hypothetical protein